MRQLVVLILSFSLFSLMTQAQGVPDPFNTALADLSGRVGVTLSLNNLSDWSWSQETFPDASLGCPQGDQAYAQVLTAGYIFSMTYNSTEYDYRSSVDGSTVFLCGTVDPNTPTSTPSPDEAYTNPLCPPLETGELPYMRNRLASDVQGQVPQGSVSNLRDLFGVNANVITQIPSEAFFRVVGGPACEDNIIWWQVDYDGTQGWIAEGQNGEYFVDLPTPQPLPVTQVITTQNANLLLELSRIEGNLGDSIAWSPDSTTLAVEGGFGWDSLLLYLRVDLTAAPRILEGERAIADIAYRPDGTQILLGSEDGTVHLWNALPDGTLQERLFLQSHLTQSTAVTFHPDNQRFVVAGDEALVSNSVNQSNAMILWDVDAVSQQSIFAGHLALVSEIAFSPDGSQMASAAGEDLRIWDVNTGALIRTLDSLEAISVTYSPNGQFIAVGTRIVPGVATVGVVLLDANTLDVVSTFTRAIRRNSFACLQPG